MLTLKFQKQFNDTIWKIQLDAMLPYMAVLLRNKEDKKGKITAIHLPSGSFVDLSIEVDWIADLIKIHQGCLFVQFYPNEALPKACGIACYDAATGKQHWINYTDTFYGFHQDSVLTYSSKIEPKTIISKDLHTGQPIHSEAVKIKEAALQFPQALNDQEESLSTIAYIIKTHYELADGIYTQYLRVLNQEQKIVVEDILNSSKELLRGDSFFVFDNQLVYIKHKQELKIYAL